MPGVVPLSSEAVWHALVRSVRHTKGRDPRPVQGLLLPTGQRRTAARCLSYRLTFRSAAARALSAPAESPGA